MTNFSFIFQIREDLASTSPAEDLVPNYDIGDRWPCRYKFSQKWIVSDGELMYKYRYTYR